MSDGHRSGRSTGRVSCKSTELLLLLLLFILLSAERHTRPSTLPGPLWWYDTIRCGVFTCLKNWLLDRLVWRTELKTEKLRRWSASVTTKSDDVRWPLYGEDEKAQDRRCADVTDRDAEWRSMAPRDHRVIGCRRYGFLAAREGASVPDNSIRRQMRCRRRNNLIINVVSPRPTNRWPNETSALTDVRATPFATPSESSPSTLAKLHGWSDVTIYGHDTIAMLWV